MSKLKKKPLLLFVIAAVALYIIIYVVPKVTGTLTPTYIAEYGELRVYDETTGYIVRNEQVYTAVKSGKANPYIEEGTLIRNGVAVMEVAGSGEGEISEKYKTILSGLGSNVTASESLKAEASGVVSYYADGYEGKVTPSSMEKLTLDYCTGKLKSVSVESLERSAVVKGEPVFKIVDRAKWYIVCFVDEDHLDRYQVGSSVDIEFMNDNDFVLADVYKVDKQDGKARIILETDFFYTKFTQLRCDNVKVTTYDQMGLIIKNKSITEENGVKGVYVKNQSDDYDFVPVKIYETDGTDSLIFSDVFYDDNGKEVKTVNIYDEILKNP